MRSFRQDERTSVEVMLKAGVRGEDVMPPMPVPDDPASFGNDEVPAAGAVFDELKAGRDLVASSVLVPHLLKPLFFPEGGGYSALGENQDAPSLKGEAAAGKIDSSICPGEEASVVEKDASRHHSANPSAPVEEKPLLFEPFIRAGLLRRLSPRCRGEQT